MRRLAELDRLIGSYGSVLVAFSGGRGLGVPAGPGGVRVLGAGRGGRGDGGVRRRCRRPSWPRPGSSRAGSACAGRRRATDEMARDGYRANAGDRCFFCKAELLDVLVPLAGRLGLAHVATGTNADDVARRLPARDPRGGRARRGHPAAPTPG